MTSGSQLPNGKLKFEHVNTNILKSWQNRIEACTQTNVATILARRKFRKIVLFFEPNIKQPKIKITLDTFSNKCQYRKSCGTLQKLNHYAAARNVNTENLEWKPFKSRWIETFVFEITSARK